MRTVIPAHAPRIQNTKVFPVRLIILFAVLLTGATLIGSAQQPATPTASPSAKKPHHSHKHSSAAKPTPPPVQPAPVAPPAPKPPDWPVNDHPADAAVEWNSQGLRIDAANSSLDQILKDVATDTGAKVEGLGADERVFGSYGPGSARDVLSQLLEGSGYNVLMIGDQGQGAPREILLSPQPKGEAPHPANNQTAANNENSDVQEQPQPLPQPPLRNGFAPGAPPRTPQQIMQEMQQRQQQIEQMQQRTNPQN